MCPTKRIEVCDSGNSPHFMAATAMPARVCVCRTQATSGRALNGAVDHIAGFVDVVVGVRLPDDLAVDVDLHEAGGGDFLIEQAIEIDQLRVLLTGNARRDVVVDKVGHSIDVDEAVAGREIEPRLPFLRGDLVFDRREVVRIVHEFRSRMVERYRTLAPRITSGTELTSPSGRGPRYGHRNQPRLCAPALQPSDTRYPSPTSFGSGSIGVAIVTFHLERKPATAMTPTSSTICSSFQWRRSSEKVCSVTMLGVELADTARSNAVRSASLNSGLV